MNCIKSWKSKKNKSKEKILDKLLKNLYNSLVIYMELKEMIEIGILLDYYKELLTEKQSKYLIEYFEEDLSLTEIAENYGISRQAVYDNVKRGIKILRNYEEKLKFYERDKELRKELLELKENFRIEKLDEIIEKLS